MCIIISKIKKERNVMLDNHDNRNLSDVFRELQEKQQSQNTIANKYYKKAHVTKEGFTSHFHANKYFNCCISCFLSKKHFFYPKLCKRRNHRRNFRIRIKSSSIKYTKYHI